VIRLDLLGDALFTLPLLEGLRSRYPRARVVMLTLPYTAPLARLSPAVDRVIEIDTNRIRTIRGLADPRTWRQYLAALRELRAERLDLAISVYGQMASLWARLSGAHRTVGYEAEAYPAVLSDVLTGGRHRERIHEVEYIRRLGRHVDAPAPSALALSLPLEVSERARVLLAGHGVGHDRALVIIHAGSINGSAKRWPAASWSRFADELHTRTGACIALIGAKADAPLAREVAAMATAPIIELAGCTDVLELAGLIEKAALVASGDSGPLHLAVALGRPLLAVYGPTDPAIYGPYRPRAPVELHRTDLPCSPCYTLAATAECPLGDPICMRLVSVDAMVRGAVQLLAECEDELAVAQQDALQDSE
jgi:lipopolysaccharide heptosyltransferase II